MSEHARGAEEIFLAALDRATAQERAAYVEAACAGDVELLRRVHELLGCHEGSQGPLDAPPPGLGSTIDPPAIHEQPGSLIGPYKLLQKLGEGGMGVVYMAEQEHPVKRRVALKIIKPGMDSAQVLARFEQERQALALMDHPNIAKVLEAGTTDAGRPYFVMELVKGIPITKFCDQEHLTPQERLELFIPVCHAVQHAHQKGIIHRDLKPSNVLIALYDGKPIPKVIDFGVAKAISQKLTERTMFTEVGQIVGTLEYMAPEQAELNNLDIDTRADIYSLGVILYELLTGGTPFTRKQLRSAAFTEMLRIIREVEPEKPSTKLSSSEELPSIAANRMLDPAKLTRLVSGDLDWIAMRCLEKERNRRYETANQLALEIQRYLHDEPVVAGPPSAAYRLRKFIRRNRRGVIAAGLLLLALLTGFAGTTWGLVEARAQRDRALKAEEQAREEAGKAKASFQLARDAVEEYTTKVSNDPRLKEKDLDALRKELLRSAVKFHQEFVTQHAEDPALRADLARAYADLSLLIRNSENASKALAVARQAVAASEQLVKEHPEESTYLLQLAQSLECLSLILDDLAVPEEAKSGYYRVLDKLEEAQRGQGKSLQGRRTFIRTSIYLAVLLTEKLGRLGEGITICRNAIAYMETDDLPKESVDVVDEARLYSALGLWLVESGQKVEAHRSCAKALETLRRLDSGENQTPSLQYAIGNVYAAIGRVHGNLSEWPEALEAFHKNVELLEKVTTLHPGLSQYERALGAEYNSLAIAQLNAGRPREALASFKKALQVKESLADRNPEVPDYKANLARTLYALAEITDELPQAQEYERRAEMLLKDLTAHYPNDVSNQGSLAECYATLAKLRKRANKISEALGALDQAIAVLEALVKSTDSTALRQSLSKYYSEKGSLCLEAGKPESAVDTFRKANALGDVEPLAQLTFGSALLQTGRLDEGIEVINKALASKPDHAKTEPLLRDCLSILDKKAPGDWSRFHVESLLGACLLGQKKYKQAEPLLLAGYEGLQRREKNLPPQGKARLKEALERVVQLYDGWGMKDKGDAWRKKVETSKAARKEPPKPP